VLISLSMAIEFMGESCNAWPVLGETYCYLSSHGASSLGPTVFCGQRNFEPSRGICPFPQNFNTAAEFHGISHKLKNDQ